jgi:hypothetical protein
MGASSRALIHGHQGIRVGKCRQRTRARAYCRVDREVQDALTQKENDRPNSLINVHAHVTHGYVDSAVEVAMDAASAGVA